MISTQVLHLYTALYCTILYYTILYYIILLILLKYTYVSASILPRLLCSSQITMSTEQLSIYTSLENQQSPL